VRAIVVGAGIGGLSAAIGLREAGHDVVVLEQAPRIEPVGAGITLFANAMRALERLGVRDAVAARGAAAKRSAVLTASGRELAQVPPDLLAGAVALHRADLHAVLADFAGEGTVHLGVQVAAVEQDADGVIVRDGEGHEHRAQLLVGADGLKSVVRPTINKAKPKYGGYTAWRGVASKSFDAGVLTESWGTGERFGVVDLGRRRTYWFATKNAKEGESDEPGGRKAELQRRFGEWHEPIAAVLDATKDNVILRNDVYHLAPMSTWHRGRVVLLGDAAHATTPGVGQGAAQAIEDAVVLAAQLATRGDLEDALTKYESLRIPRTTFVQRQSRRADRVAQLGNARLCRLRDEVFARLPERARRRQVEPLVHHQL
jgi:2-polyprenyl-6-methoxyphenol hydroxylase-like FAD-dependent oxidoreductase